nr:MAG TPA: hypothetical protein [Caudoviricetes sp.]
MIMAADYSVQFQTFPVRIFLLLRNKTRGHILCYLSNKPSCEIKLIK